MRLWRWVSYRPLSWSSYHKGLCFAILAPLLYALKAVNIKYAPPLKVEHVVLSRYLLDFIFLAPLYLRSRKKLSSEKAPFYGLRAACSLITGCCSLYGIRHLALADALLLENTMPLFIPLIFWIWQGEKITSTSWAFLLLGFSSLFFLLKPQLDVFHLASLASLATGLLSAILTVSIRMLSVTESPLAMYFHFNLCAGLLSIGLCAYTWEGFPEITAFAAFSLVLNSLIGMSFQYSIIKAYSLIAPHLVGSLAYSGILFSSAFGWIIWNESLSLLQVIGGGILVTAGILMICQARKEKLAKTAYPSRAEN